MMLCIEEQPEALARVLGHGLVVAPLRAALAARQVQKIWIAGSGTSVYAAMIAARCIERSCGIDAEAITSLELLDEVAAPLFGPRTLLIGISQSGSTLVLLEAMRQARQRGALTVAITAEPASPIAAAAEFVFDALTGPEEALAKTKGFATTALAACLLGPLLASSGNAADRNDAALLASFADLPAAAAEVIARSKAAVVGWAERFKSTSAAFVVATGPMYGAACEGGLKILEVAKFPVISKELEEMMHGPFNAVGPDVGIILLAGATPVPSRLAAFLKGAAAVGMPLLTIAADAAVARTVPHAFDLVLPTIAEPAVAPILAVMPLQVFAEQFARQRQVPIDTARYPFLYPIFGSKAIHLAA
jgi:fructoselysine-6-P-deglycase FrlB-like protein